MYSMENNQSSYTFYQSLGINVFIIITVHGYLHLFKFFNNSLKQASRLKIYVSSVNEYCKKLRESLPNT